MAKKSKNNGARRQGEPAQPSKPATAAKATPPPGDRIAIVAGLRTPFTKAGTALKRMRTTDWRLLA